MALPLVAGAAALAAAVAKGLWESKRMATIVASLVALGVLVKTCFGWLWEILWEAAWKYVLNLFDPILIVDFAIALLGAMLSGLSVWFPADIQSSMNYLGNLLINNQIKEIMGVVLWLISPLIPAVVLLAAARTVVLIWVGTSVLKLVMRAKHEIPGGGSGS